MNDVASEFITVDECAGLLRLNRKTVYDAIKDGKLPGARAVRGTIRIRKAILLAAWDAGWVPDSQRKRSK